MVKTIQLTTRYSDDWCAEQKKLLLDSRHFDSDKLFGRESVNLIKPNGEPLFLLRKGALPPDICEAARPILRKAGRHDSGYRGYVSATTGYYDRPTCRMTAFTRDHLAEWETIQPFVASCNRVFAKHNRELGGRYVNQRVVAGQTEPEFRIGDTAFTTMTVNLGDKTHDARTTVHQDDGDLAEGFGVISVLSRGEYSGGYLIFPAYRVAVDIRTTDVLLCDVHEYHGNAPLEAVGAWERIAVVLYYRTAMRHCGGNPRAR